MRETEQRPGTDPARTMRVAAYIRVSTTNPEQEDSYELQERYFTKLLSENPTWDSVGVYTDYAISATNTSRRTGFRRLLRHCTEGRIDHIVSKSISRFARNTSDFLSAVRILKECGVTIYFEKENINTADETSEFIMTTLGALAQEESRSISENIRWGYQKRSQLGEARNIDIYGYRFASGKDAFSVTKNGYRFRNINVAQDEAEVVRWIFEEVAKGRSYISIARDLNSQHISAPGEDGDDENLEETDRKLKVGWTGKRVRDVAALERYAGDLLLQKSFIANFLTHKSQKNDGELPMFYVKDHHEPIISRDLFLRVQEVVAERGKRTAPTARTNYPLSGRLVCASCGSFFHTYNRKCHPMWMCGTVRLNNGSGACHMKRIYEEQVMRALKKAAVLRFDISVESGGVEALRKTIEEIHESDNAENERMRYVKRFGQLNGINDRQEMEKLMEELKHREEYWAVLEEDYEIRREAIAWLRTLKEDEAGVNEFFRGLMGKYVKAFVISITVYSPIEYEVRWFDETETKVELDTNIRDHRYKISEEIWEI